jgi:hypothetical protein
MSINPNKLAEKYRALIKSKAPIINTAHTEKGHFYVSPNDDKPYHSVTYFTSFIKDPSLANYKMNRALDSVIDKWKPNQSYDQQTINSLVESAKSAPEGYFLLAGDIGTQTHAWRQEWFQSWINSDKGMLTEEEINAVPLPQNVDSEVISGCRAIKKFVKDTGYIPVACELALVDDELKVGGQIDDLGVFPNKHKMYYTSSSKLPSDLKIEPGSIISVDPLDGGYKFKFNPQLVFVDLKTSNQGKKPSYAFQVRGFYQRMLKKTLKLRPKKTYILHTSKEDGTYKLIDLTDMTFLERDAEYLVHCSRSWDKAVAAFKPKIITI